MVQGTARSTRGSKITGSPASLGLSAGATREMAAAEEAATEAEEGATRGESTAETTEARRGAAGTKQTIIGSELGTWVEQKGPALAPQM